MKNSCLRALIAFPVIAFLYALSGFTTRLGGEGFEMFRNSKLLLQQFGNNMKEIRTLTLEDITASDKITIKYYHCGTEGKNRHLIIRGSDNKEIRNFQFSNVSSDTPGMSFHPAEILNGKSKSQSEIIHVYYRSDEIPNGRLIVKLRLLVTATDNLAKRNADTRKKE